MSKEKLENDILADVKQLEQESGTKIIDKEDPILTSEQDAALDAEIELEEKYGDQNLRTFAEGAASGASFGLSDQVLTKSGISTQEELRERRKRNSTAATAGEITGVVGPALLSGGSSLIAKSVGAGVKTAARAGGAIERLTAKGLTKLLAETGKKSLAREVLKKSIAKGAGSAVEGSFYGAGKLISEEALGNADFNAENFISHVGTAALLGGVAGSAFGTVEAVVPVIKGDKVVNWVSKKFKGKLDPARNAQELSGASPSAIHKMKTFNPALYEHTPKMLKEVMNKKGLSSFATEGKTFNTIKTFIQETGDDIGKSLDNINDILVSKGALPKRSSISRRIVDRLNGTTKQFRDAEGRILAGAKPKIRKINRVIAAFDQDLVSDKIMPVKAINDLKSKYQKLAKWDRRGNLPLEEEINREISRALREEVMELAEKAGGTAGEKLKRELLNYGSASEFAANFGKKIDTQKASSFFSMRDVVMGGFLGMPGKIAAGASVFAKSDLKKKLIILTGVEGANAAVTKKLSSGVSGFLKSAKPALIPSTTKVLLSSSLSHKQKEGEKPKKAKDKKEAFQNIRENIQNVSQDPDKLYDYMNLGNLEDAAPLAASQARITLSGALQFLSSKLPKSAAPQGMFPQREWEPSTMEMAKFEKYLQAVENPMSVIEDLKAGVISRESVEALQAVYPNLYQRVQESVIDQVSRDPEVSYEKRLNLGILLDLPADASLHPESIRGLQAHFKEAQQSKTGGAISATQASKLDFAESQATEVQKVSNRKDK